MNMFAYQINNKNSCGQTSLLTSDFTASYQQCGVVDNKCIATSGAEVNIPTALDVSGYCNETLLNLNL